MAFNVNAFRSNGLIYDGARPTAFQIRMNFPTIASSGNSETNRLQFLAYATSLPESNIDDIPVPYFGRFIKVDGNRTFGDWTISVLMDEDFTIKAAFEAWNNGINAHVSNLKDPAFLGQGYKSSATVYQLSKEGGAAAQAGQSAVENAIRAYTFSGLWPKNIGPVRVDWGDVNRIEVFDVTFAYDWWVPGADETFTAASGSFNGIDGTAKNWSPILSGDNGS